MFLGICCLALVHWWTACCPWYHCKRCLAYGKVVLLASVVCSYTVACNTEQAVTKLSYGCEIWKLEAPHTLSCMSTVHNMFLQRSLHVCKSTAANEVLCELGQEHLKVFWQKMTLNCVAKLVELPKDRLVKKACTHVSVVRTRWFQQVFTWFHDHRFQGILTEGIVSVSSTVDILLDAWPSSVCPNIHSSTDWLLC